MKSDLRKDIVKHLIDKGNYDPLVDDVNIDLLIQNIKYATEAATILDREGIRLTMPNGNGFDTTKENPAFGTYEKCIHNIHTCASKLGINRRERITLKLLEEKVIDDFDKF